MYEKDYGLHPFAEELRRQVKVRVNQSNLVVIARDSYIYSQKKTDGTQTNEPQSSKPGAQGNNQGNNLGQIR